MLFKFDIGLKEDYNDPFKLNILYRENPNFTIRKIQTFCKNCEYAEFHYLKHP